MRQLGNGLSDAKHHKDALPVQEAELSMLRRIGASEEDILLSCRTILRSRITSLDGRKRLHRCIERVYSGI